MNCFILSILMFKVINYWHITNIYNVNRMGDQR